MDLIGKTITLPFSGEARGIIQCSKCGHPMVNVDLDELSTDDLEFLRWLGVRVSNPKTEGEVCSSCKYQRRQLVDHIRRPSRNYTSPVSTTTHSSPTPIFGGFGGFGGGGFGGGGASR